MLLVNTSSDVYAAGNDWFEKDQYFSAYYDGVGSVHFSLLTWTEGASYNHWAYCDTTKKDSTYWTYVEYSTDGKEIKDATKKWTKLFYYHGDNVINKKDTGRAWFWSDSVSNLFYTIPEERELERKLNPKGDSVSILHAQDDRRSISFKLRWAVPKWLEGKKVTMRVRVSDARAVGSPWSYPHTLLTEEKMEEGSVPELMEPMLFMGGDNPKDAGKILVPYVVLDELLVLKTSLAPNDSLLNPPAMGSVAVKATNSLQKGFYINAKVKKVNGDVLTLKSNSIDIPAYHTIQQFKVVPKLDTIRGANDTNMFVLMNRGQKLVQWAIDSAQQKDAMPMDFFEIERAYKSDFSDAEQIGMVAYVQGQEKYEHLDENSINNPNGNDSIFYRIRRMSASSFGWKGHKYAASCAYVGRVKQIGMDLYNNTRPYTPYAAFRDCATDTIVDNNKIDLSGQFVWPIGDSAKTIAWDPNTSIEVVLWDDQEEANFVAIKKDNLVYNVYSNELVIEFAYTAELPKTCQEYDLSVRLNTAATHFDKPQNTEVWFYPKMRTTAVNMTKVKASQGDEEHPERTHITWMADGEPTYFTVWRSDEQGTVDSLAQCDGKTNWYDDTQGVPGQPYTYMVKAVTLCSGEEIETTLAATGSRSRYGYIDGYITYTNGNKMGGIEVSLQQGKNTIASTYTKADGYYKFSKIQYNLDGSQYEVMVSDKHQSFKPVKGGDMSIQVTLSQDNPVAHHADFVSDSYQTCSGRVLYTGTTIPVRDAYFLIGDQVAMNNNDTIRSDASGNFVLSIPTKKQFTLTVAKKGHTFLNGGKLVDDKGNTTLNPSGSLYGVKFWDETRVRLIGRLAGGDIQGQKTLGFGLSQNNLGDSLKLVLELEGDNIAHFVYDENNVSKTTRDTTFISAIDRDTILRTPVRFEQKRVIVRPDKTTGEYVIDLPPVKYRIVEASANGYATLFSAGRTSETKDLTFSLDTQYINYEGRAAWYHDMYSVVYHSPAVVRVQQQRYGMPIGHYGEEVVNGYTLGKTRTDSVCTHKDGTWKYVFGYPVYLSGLQYGFRLRAREEYYYNNDINNKLDTVPLGGHKFTVYNGLLSGTSIVKGQLNNEGVFDVVLDVANVTYDAIGDAALKHLDVSVDVNGQDVHAEPIKAFVLGNRITGADAMQKIGKVITVDDVLRDPPGSHSYAWIEKGATYNSSYSVNNGFDAGLEFSYTNGRKVNQTVGSVSLAGNIMAMNGTQFGTFTQNESGKTWPIISFSLGFNWNTNYNYSYTTSERIQTGNDNNIIGADATVFIGHTTNVYAMHSEVVTVVDSATLSRLQPSIATGETKVISQKDIHSPAVIVTTDAAFTLDESPVQFVYTQDHIVNQVIPQLVAEMSSLVRSGNSDSLQAIANSTQKIVYWYNPSKDSVECIKPTGWGNKPFTNEVKEYAKLINRWYEILYVNEQREVYGTTDMNRVGNFSVSGNTTVTYSESGSAGYNDSFAMTEKVKGDFVKILNKYANISGGNNPDWINKYMKNFIQNNIAKDPGQEIKTNIGPTEYKLNFTPNIDPSFTQTYGRSESRNRTIGFTLSQAEYGYIDVDVYNLEGTIDSTMKSWRDKATNFKTRDSLQTGHYDCSDFIYLLRGGATRCPWLGENKTQFYRPGIVLDPATVKLDEAHLEVD
ncbi:MAG: hypothetical protein MJZ48_05135, partial [Paludibacteraceae bacterium]|nr:hypothetical protein [Paludibacteraceae bacterium]